MAGPPSTRCARVINRRLRPQSDFVWISDSALATAFDRYCSISRVAVRHGSSVPGPLESRRRTGKRHMGELSFGQVHSSAPSWGLENAIDLSKWQWKPPTLHSTRLAKSDMREKQSLWTSMLNWLSAESSSQTAPGQMADSETMDNSNVSAATVLGEYLADATSQPRLDMSLPIDLQKGDEAVTASITATSIIEIGLKSLELDASLFLLVAGRPHFTAFCTKLSDVAAGGQLSGHALCLVIETLSQSLEEGFQALPVALHSKTTARLQFLLLTAATAGMKARYIASGLFDGAAWTVLLQKCSQLSFINVPLFGDIMSCIPDSQVDYAAPGILANLETRLLALAKPSETRHENLTRYVHYMANALQRLDSAEHQHLLQAATRRLCCHAKSPNVDFATMCYAWLQILAGLPRVVDSYLVETVSMLERGVMAKSLAPKQICYLFLTRLRNQHQIQDMAIYRVLRDANDWDCYGRVASHFWCGNQPQYIESLCQFLRRLGRQQNLTHLVLILTKIIEKNEVTSLANIALRLGHPEQALKILFLYGESRRASKDFFWRTPFADEVLEVIMNIKGLLSTDVLRAIGLLNPLGRSKASVSCSSRKSSRARRRHKLPSVHLRRRAYRVERAALAFSRSTQFSNRVALSRVTDCIKFFQSINAEIPPRVLQALSSIVTRDLAEGKLGRTSRLRWYIHLLSKHAGPQATNRAVQFLNKRIALIRAQRPSNRRY